MVRRVTVTLCLVALLASAAVFAATTSRMTGEVYDNEGQPMPGVTVQISSDKLIGGPQVAISDANGRFTFNLLPVGMYTVEANLVGFQPVTGQVQVALDRTAQIIFNMIPEQFGGEIEVSARVPVVDVAQVNSSVTFDEQFLQKAAVGSANRDYLDMIGKAAGVAGSGNASVFGGSSSDNSYLIDGLNTTDPTTGTFGTNFNFDAIQEMNFQTGGFEAEFGQATGGIVNLVTKSGGNEFSGSLDIRYRDQNMTENGDHYDRDEQDTLYQSISGTLGGPILRDRLWFFGSLEKVDTSRQNQDVRFPREFDGWNYIGKLTWQVADSHRAVLKYSGAPADVTLWSDIYTDISARGNQYQTSDIWQGELNSVLSESVLLNASVGFFSNEINAGAYNDDTETSGHSLRVEDRSLVAPQDFPYFYHSYPSTSLNDRFRDEYRVNTTVFVDDFLGSHEFKLGAEYSDMQFDIASWYNGGAFIYDQLDGSAPGGYQFQDINGDGYFNAWMTLKEPLETARDTTTSTGDILTFFAQDAWRPHPNVTVKPGVRFDNVGLANHIGEAIADMDSWQPRLGIAWDITGNSKYVLRASAGRFMDPTALSIPSFASGVTEIYHDYNTMEFYCNATRGLLCDPDDFPASFGDPIFFTSGEGNQYVLFDNRTEPTIYDPAQTLDQAGVGHLETPHSDQYIIAFETQVARDTSIELQYVNKRTENIIEDTCSNNSWAWGDGERPSLDDPSTWTTGAGCEFFMITNFEDFYRDYEAFILQAETRRERFHLLASWTYSDSYGNTANGALQSYATELADFYPVHFFNREGNLPDHREHRFKLNGYYLFPRNWTVGFDGFYSSAGHQTVFSTCANLQNADPDDPLFAQFGTSHSDLVSYCSTGDGAFLGTTDIFISERGAYETKSIWQLDVQASKTWNLNKFDITAVFTVYNILDNEADQSFNTEAFVSREVGETVTWWLPRRYEVGFRIEF